MLTNIECNIVPYEKVNSMCVDNYDEKFMLDVIRQLNQLMVLRMTYQGASMLIDEVENNGHGRISRYLTLPRNPSYQETNRLLEVFE
jgi:hypothetical protein